MRDIKMLHPELQDKIEKLKALCEKEGLKLGIGECFRTVAEQDALYAQGRTKPGSIVTNAKGSTYSSQHQWGIAFDFFKNVSGHAYDDTAFFKRVGALAKSIGLGWGGDWKSPVDMPHCYLPKWGSTTQQLRVNYGTFEKFKATWKPVRDYSMVLDEPWYSNKYPDLAKAFQGNTESLKNHFVEHGMKEGRRGNILFDPTFYKNKYKDLRGAFGNDWIMYYEHFIAHGIKEGRQGSAEFNPAVYKERYTDLRKAFGNDWAKYYEHYMKHGRIEGRKGS